MPTLRNFCLSIIPLELQGFTQARGIQFDGTSMHAGIHIQVYPGDQVSGNIMHGENKPGCMVR
jgi:hypothetical protein